MTKIGLDTMRGRLIKGELNKDRLTDEIRDSLISIRLQITKKAVEYIHQSTVY